MNVALDTNRYTDFMRGEETVAQTLELARSIVVPFIVVAELRAGFVAGTRVKANEVLLSEFLEEHDVSILFPDVETVNHYVGLFGELRRAGKMIPVHDLWIAALCVQHSLILCTRDAHFDHFPQLSRV